VNDVVVLVVVVDNAASLICMMMMMILSILIHSSVKSQKIQVSEFPKDSTTFDVTTITNITTNLNQD